VSTFFALVQQLLLASTVTLVAFRQTLPVICSALGVLSCACSTLGVCSFVFRGGCNKTLRMCMCTIVL
jgi:hypothetical protein